MSGNVMLASGQRIAFVRHAGVEADNVAVRTAADIAREVAVTGFLGKVGGGSRPARQDRLGELGGRLGPIGLAINTAASNAARTVMVAQIAASI